MKNGFKCAIFRIVLTLSWRRSQSYRSQSFDLLCKLMDWFLYDRDLRHEIVKTVLLRFTVFPVNVWCPLRKVTRIQTNLNWSFRLQVCLGMYDLLVDTRHEPSGSQPHKLVKHTRTIRRQKPKNCLSVFDHFVGLALKGLKQSNLHKSSVPIYYIFISFFIHNLFILI